MKNKTIGQVTLWSIAVAVALMITDNMQTGFFNLASTVFVIFGTWSGYRMIKPSEECQKIHAPVVNHLDR